VTLCSLWFVIAMDLRREGRYYLARKGLSLGRLSVPARAPLLRRLRFAVALLLPSLLDGRTLSNADANLPNSNVCCSFWRLDIGH
jgi:hypothetical protein